MFLARGQAAELLPVGHVLGEDLEPQFGETLALFTNRLPADEISVVSDETFWDGIPNAPRVTRLARHSHQRAASLGFPGPHG